MYTLIIRKDMKRNENYARNKVTSLDSKTMQCSSKSKGRKINRIIVETLIIKLINNIA